MNMTSYRTTMREALAIMNEDNLEKMRKAAGGAKQTLKMKDGSIGMDSFTASAIMQIYDKVNDKNKKTMENLLKDGKKADIVKLMKFAMSKVNAEYVPEEFEEEFELDEGFINIGGAKVKDDEKSILQHIKKTFPNVKKVRKDPQHGWIPVFEEEFELDEARKSQGMFIVLEKGSKNKVIGQFKEKDKAMEMMKKNAGSKVIQIGKFATVDDKPVDIKVGDNLSDTRVKLSTKIKEEVELDENLQKAKKLMGPSKNREQGIEFVMKGLKISKQKATQMVDKILDEEVELDEGRMKELHGYIEQGMSAKEIAKKMKLDVKTIQALMPKKEEVEEGAAADARRAMRRDPDMKQRAFSKDDSATDDERKAASKNIMMQMRKAVSLRSFDVEFADGKKVKIPQKVAQAVLQKYNSFRKPADKEKYQAKVGKSYKDMLSALKEDIGNMKKESTLERMNKKIQEKKNG